MRSFKDFINFNEELGELNPVQAPKTPNLIPLVNNPNKPWKAKRAEAIEFWNQLQMNLPLMPEPIDESHSGSRFHQDGIRITGSVKFINSILSRLKDLLKYEQQPGTKLELEYREVEKSSMEEGRPTYVFYVHVLEDKPKI